MRNDILRGLVGSVVIVTLRSLSPACIVNVYIILRTYDYVPYGNCKDVVRSAGVEQVTNVGSVCGQRSHLYAG